MSDSNDKLVHEVRASERRRKRNVVIAVVLGVLLVVGAIVATLAIMLSTLAQVKDVAAASRQSAAQSETLLRQVRRSDRGTRAQIFEQHRALVRGLEKLARELGVEEFRFEPLPPPARPEAFDPGREGTGPDGDGNGNGKEDPGNGGNNGGNGNGKPPPEDCEGFDLPVVGCVGPSPLVVLVEGVFGW